MKLNDRGSIGATFTIIIVVFLSAVVMFIFPLMTELDQGENISQMSVQELTVVFVDKVRTTGKLTLDDYDDFVEKISATGNAYDISMKIGILDENQAKKSAIVSSDKVGENSYYYKFASQLLSELQQDDTHTVLFKEGDIFTVEVKLDSIPVADQLHGTVSGTTSSVNDTYGPHSGMVMANGEL